MEEYLDLTRNGILTPATSVNLEDNMLSEKSKASHRRTHTVQIHFCKAPRRVRFTGTESRRVGANLGGGGDGSPCLMGTEFQFYKMKSAVCRWWNVCTI